jgi:GDP-L-fucose synthase
MRKILVTGSGGLVGHALKRLNPADCFFATRDDADLTDFEATKRLFEKVQPTHVIHLAAAVGGIGGNSIHSGEYFKSNIMMNLNVLEVAREFKVEKVISFMSTCVFPVDSSYPLTVDQLHDGPPHASNFGYAYAKRMLEVQSSAYRKEFNCNFITLIPTNIYGPGDYWNLEEGHVIPSLIHKFYNAKKTSTNVKLWGSGSPLREFIYSDDVAKLILWAMANYDDVDPLILTPSEEVSIKELSETVSRLVGFQGEIVWDIEKPDGQLRKPSSNERLLSLNSEVSFTPLEEGLQKTIEWFLLNYPKLRL